jgi:AcrR family transcriptional regulator
MAGRTPYPVAARELLRNTLLDAARDLLQEHPWSEVTMADIAGVAGVSRQTLYNEFGSRDEFAQALVIREGDRFLEDVTSAVRENADEPRRALEAALEVFLTAAADDPLIRTAIFDTGSDGLLPMVTTQGQPVVARETARLALLITETWPVTQHDATLIAEVLVRLGISYATLPEGSPRATAAAVVELLGPFIDQAVERITAAQAEAA